MPVWSAMVGTRMSMAVQAFKQIPPKVGPIGNRLGEDNPTETAMHNTWQYYC